MKYIDISVKAFPVNVIFCLNSKTHYKYLTKNHSWISEEEKEMNTAGITTYVKEKGKLSLIVGIDTETTNIYEAKALIVHELSHCVTELMAELNLNCDEVRSYLLQSFYLDTIPFYDDYIEKKRKKGK